MSNLYTRWDFRALLELNAVGIIQPDICHAGGITELKKIAAMAETYYVNSRTTQLQFSGRFQPIASGLGHLDIMAFTVESEVLMQEILPDGGVVH